MMLGTIASYAPVISPEFIVSEAVCLNDVWTRLRIHYGFRKSGALILDLTSISREEGESYEVYLQRFQKQIGSCDKEKIRAQFYFLLVVAL